MASGPGAFSGVHQLTCSTAQGGTRSSCDLIPRVKDVLAVRISVESK